VKEVKARKEHYCDCCCVTIQKGEKYFVKTTYHSNSKFLDVERYCKDCAPWIAKGLSYRQARIKAFGSPILRGWRRPDV